MRPPSRCGGFNWSHPAKLIARERVDDFWKMVDEVQNGVLFVLLGLEVLAIPFQWFLFGSGATAIVAVACGSTGRGGNRVVLHSVAGQARESSVLVLTWGGLHGGLSLALALALPLNDGRTWISGNNLHCGGVLDGAAGRLAGILSSSLQTDGNSPSRPTAARAVEVEGKLRFSICRELELIFWADR